MESNIDLSGLKGLHFPLEPDLFPLAVGWWVVLLILLGLIVAFISIGFHLWLNPKNQALRELRQLYRQNADRPVVFAKELSKLLKRVAILKFGREKTADLAGEYWAAFLREKGRGSLNEMQADWIAGASYRPPSASGSISTAELVRSAKKWIKLTLKGK